MTRKTKRDVIVINKQELSSEDLRNIVKWNRDKRFTQLLMARMFGISPRDIEDIITGKISQ